NPSNIGAPLNRETKVEQRGVKTTGVPVQTAPHPLKPTTEQNIPKISEAPKFKATRGYQHYFFVITGLGGIFALVLSFLQWRECLTRPVCYFTGSAILLYPKQRG